MKEFWLLLKVCDIFLFPLLWMSLRAKVLINSRSAKEVIWGWGKAGSMAMPCTQLEKFQPLDPKFVTQILNDSEIMSRFLQFLMGSWVMNISWWRAWVSGYFFVTLLRPIVFLPSQIPLSPAEFGTTPWDTVCSDLTSNHPFLSIYSKAVGICETDTGATAQGSFSMVAPRSHRLSPKTLCTAQRCPIAKLLSNQAPSQVAQTQCKGGYEYLYAEVYSKVNHTVYCSI